MEPLPVGRMILKVPVDECLCGHDYDDHPVGPVASPCSAKGCGCLDFEDDDPDDDWVPGFDEDDEA